MAARTVNKGQIDATVPQAGTASLGKIKNLNWTERCQDPHETVV